MYILFVVSDSVYHIETCIQVYLRYIPLLGMRSRLQISVASVSMEPENWSFDFDASSTGHVATGNGILRINEAGYISRYREA